MSDNGDNQEKLAQAEAKITELEQQVSGLTAELDKQKTIVDNAETKFNEMAAETGASRKAIADAATGLIELRGTEKKAQIDLGAAQDELVKLKSTIKGLKVEQGQSGDPTPEKTAEEIEAELSSAEQSVMDKTYEAWYKKAQAGDAEAVKVCKRFKGDAGFRKACLLKAKDEAEAERDSDLSDWRKKPAHEESPSGGGDELAEQVNRLFKNNIESADFVPASSSGGASRATGPHNRRPVNKPDADWME